jgi:hypothetical protein
MNDTIRTLTICELGKLAARETVRTGLKVPNPYEGTTDGPIWQAAYQRQLDSDSLDGSEA